MRAVRHVGPRKVEVVDIPRPEPGPGEALIAMRRSGVCGSDLHVYRKEPRPDPAPNVLGHEPCGVVAEVGRGVKHLEVGDRVSVYHYEGCGHCARCLEGNRMWCSSKGRGIIGHSRQGSHADMMAVDAANCLKLPDELTFVDGAFIACGAGTTWSALRKIGPTAEHSAVVFGLGPVGLVGVAMLRAFGARVAAAGRRASRLEAARKLGAEPVVDIDAEKNPAGALRKGFPGGFDLAYETSGSPDAQRQMVDLLARFGRGAVVGFGSHGPAINASSLAGKQASLAGSFVMNIGEYEALARFMVERLPRLDAIVTHAFPIERAAEALETADRLDCAKVVFEWPD